MGHIAADFQGDGNTEVSRARLNKKDSGSQSTDDVSLTKKAGI